GRNVRCGAERRELLIDRCPVACFGLYQRFVPEHDCERRAARPRELLLDELRGAAGLGGLDDPTALEIAARRAHEDRDDHERARDDEERPTEPVDQVPPGREHVRFPFARPDVSDVTYRSMATLSTASRTPLTRVRIARAALAIVASA